MGLLLKIDSVFLASVLPYSGIILTIYYTTYGLCKIRPQQGRMYTRDLKFSNTRAVGLMWPRITHKIEKYELFEKLGLLYHIWPKILI